MNVSLPYATIKMYNTKVDATVLATALHCKDTFT
jgi:hypothetical protein